MESDIGTHPDRGAASPNHGAPRRPSFLYSGYWLVLGLLVISYALCAAQVSRNPSAVALLVQLVTVAVTLWVARVRPAQRTVGWTVLAIAAAGTALVMVLGTQGHVLAIVLSGASMVAYLVAPVAIIAHQSRRRRIDGQTLLAAIAAYVMVGMFYTFVFNLIGLLSAQPTFGVGNVDSLTGQLFFSFTTLTTTGYGNLVPVDALVQSVAIAETITGQLFLVIAVARVVDRWNHPRDSAGRQPRPPTAK